MCIHAKDNIHMLNTHVHDALMNTCIFRPQMNSSPSPSTSYCCTVIRGARDPLERVDARGGARWGVDVIAAGAGEDGIGRDREEEAGGSNIERIRHMGRIWIWGMQYGAGHGQDCIRCMRGGPYRYIVHATSYHLTCNTSDH